MILSLSLLYHYYCYPLRYLYDICVKSVLQSAVNLLKISADVAAARYLSYLDNIYLFISLLSDLIQLPAASSKSINRTALYSKLVRHQQVCSPLVHTLLILNSAAQ